MMLQEEIRALYMKISAGEMTEDAFAAAMTALQPVRKSQEWGVGISEYTGKCLIRGLRENGRPLEMSEREVLALADNDNVKWLEVVKFVKENTGKFVITKKHEKKATVEVTPPAATPPAAPVA
jgi:hypothetical protein